MYQKLDKVSFINEYDGFTIGKIVKIEEKRFLFFKKKTIYYICEWLAYTKVYNTIHKITEKNIIEKIDYID